MPVKTQKTNQKSTFSFSQYKNVIVPGVALLLTLSFAVAGFIMFNRQNNQVAQANNQITLSPGQEAAIVIDYINNGDEDSQTAKIQIAVGSQAEIVTGSIKETYGTDAPVCINDDLVVVSSNVSALFYVPRSSTTPVGSANCGGVSALNSEGSSNLLAAPTVQLGTNPNTWQQDRRGKLEFTIRMKSTVTEPNNTVFGSPLSTGVTSQLFLDGRSQPLSELTIRLTRNEPTIISQPNISSCEGGTVTIGNTYSCDFPLVGDATNTYALPPDPITGWTSTGDNTTPLAGSQSTPCTILNNGTPSVSLSCVAIGTTNGTPGPNNILIQIGSGTPTDKGNVLLAAPIDPTQFTESGRVYFIGRDNAPLVWDEITQYNSSFNKTQKFRDGPITMIYDQIKDENGDLVTSGTCTFEILDAFSSYQPINLVNLKLNADQTDVIRDTNGNATGEVKDKFTNRPITNGQCQATFDVEDQASLNYYHVVTKANTTAGNYRQTGMIILKVGG